MNSMLVITAVLLLALPGLGQDGVEYSPLSRVRVPLTQADSATAVPVRPLFVWLRAATLDGNNGRPVSE